MAEETEPLSGFSHCPECNGVVRTIDGFIDWHSVSVLEKTNYGDTMKSEHITTCPGVGLNILDNVVQEYEG